MTLLSVARSNLLASRSYFDRREIKIVDFWSRLDAVADRNDVLRHPFYTRWSEGALTREELALYSGQYRHAVQALAGAAAGAARAAEPRLQGQLEAHAAEERSHVALWDQFVDAVGGDRGAAPRSETAACAAAWAGEDERPLLESLIALYAIESAQPAISATKRAGLERFYGIGGAGAAYFELHEQLDVEHATAARELIDARLEDADADALIAEAERVLRANWELLDGVERACGR
jgi:pyrroloquinoline-quinone synthase